MSVDFYIYVAGSTEDGFFVGGSGDHGVVRIGTVFTEARFGRDGLRKPIRLTVVKILAYGHELDELPAPVSGRLFLQGEGGAELASRVFIFSEE